MFDLRLLANEAAAARALPEGLAGWPPVRRLSAMRPVERVRTGVGLFGIVAAAVASWAGDADAWPGLVRRLSDAGLLLPGDPPALSGDCP